jgi:hypothetical protein
MDKKAFKLRERQPEKEVNHSNFRMKSFSTIDRLNSMYVDDQKVLDCEVFSMSPKKRFSLAQAQKRNLSKQKLINDRVMKQLYTNPLLIEQEKEELIKKFSKTTLKFDEVIKDSRTPGFDDQGSFNNSGQPTENQRIYQMIKDNMLKREQIKQNQFAVKNFMIPTYHQKTHFKAAAGLQMQTLESLKAKDAEL